MNIPTKAEMEAAIEELAKESTAPDKDTPDWIKTDIRRGMMWMLGRILKGQP